MSKFPRSIIRKSNIDNIFAQIECPINFYRAPKFIFNPENSNENSINTDLFQNFCEMLSKVDKNTPIIVIMVFGMYQIGKSTFLKAITGNGAYKIGNGSRTTTKGIIMDGPYYISYLKNRLSDDIINELKKQNANPAIFFIDSQGTGDRSAKEIEKTLKRIHSIFCSLSTICIYVTKLNEPEDNFNKSLKIIKQMKLQNDDFHKIFFLVRTDGNNEIEDIIEEKTREDFIQAKTQLISSWSYSKVIYECLPKRFVEIIPFGNISNQDVFNYSVFNSLIDILNNAKPLEMEKIIQSLNNKIELFFSEQFDKLYSQFRKEDFPENIQSSQFYMRIYTLIRIFLVQIDDSFEEFKKNKISKSEKILRYQLMLKSFFELSSYIIKDDDEMKEWDYQQYFSEINECICKYLANKEPDFEFALNNEQISPKAKYGGYAASLLTGSASALGSLAAKSALIEKTWEFTLIHSNILSANALNGLVATKATTTALTATQITATFSTTSKILSLAVPTLGVAAALALAGGLAWFVYNKINDNHYKRIKEKNPKLSIPFLWEIEDKKNINKVKKVSFSPNGIIDSKIKDENVIIAIENPNNISTNFYPMKFVIQSLTGIPFQTDSLPNNKEALLFGPFKKKNLLSRISNFELINDSNLDGKVSILYLLNCQVDKHKCRNVKSIISSISFLEPNKNQIPHIEKINNSDINLFCFDNEIHSYPIDEIKYRELINSTKTKINENIDNINILPIFMENIDRFGSVTNRTLMISLNKLFK